MLAYCRVTSTIVTLPREQAVFNSMKHKHTPIIGADFVDAFGIRSTTFELCRMHGGRLQSFAIVWFDNARIVKNPDAAQEIYEQGEDLSFEAYKQEAKDKLRSALSDYFSSFPRGLGKEQESALDEAVDAAFEAVEDGINEAYQPDNAKMRYAKDGLVIETCLDGDFIILKSPFFTYAQFCSPCVPGACNLDSPLEQQDKECRCYCLPADWFDDGKAPYVVYSVDTGNPIEA